MPEPTTEELIQGLQSRVEALAKTIAGHDQEIMATTARVADLNHARGVALQEKNRLLAAIDALEGRAQTFPSLSQSPLPKIINNIIVEPGFTLIGDKLVPEVAGVTTTTFEPPPLPVVGGDFADESPI